MVPASPTARVLAACLTAAMMGLAGAAHSPPAEAAAAAAEAPPAPNGASAAPQASESARAGGEDNAPSEREKPATGEPSSSTEVFVPSEEISEDFTVSFPVDI